MGEDIRIERKRVEDFIPDPANANLGTERGARVHEDSIRQTGAGRSGLADRNGVLIAGNKTHEQLADAGIEDVIVVHTTGKEWVVVQRDDLDLLNDDERATARRAAYFDNRAAQLSINFSAEQIVLDAQQGVDLSTMWTEVELTQLEETVSLSDLEDGIDAGDPISRDPADVACTVGEYRFVIPRQKYLEWQEGIRQNIGFDRVTVTKEILRRLGV